MYKTLCYEQSDGIVEIKLNRPERHNAINAQMSDELAAAWQRFKHAPDAIVAIITAAGERSFCSGADIADLPQLDLSNADAALEAMRWTSAQNGIWKPVICAVDGAVMGGGLHFVADSDIVLASDRATFSDSHVNVGLVSGLESVALARRLPLQAVLRMALVGGKETLNATQAQQLGLVGELLAPAQLIDRAYVLATLMCENSPSAMAATKKAIWAAKEMGLSAANRYAWELIIAHNKSPDFTEGGRAFLEKRRPNWQPLDANGLTAGGE
jgi:enoyl-CoA hydratase/carnithine racemase